MGLCVCKFYAQVQAVFKKEHKYSSVPHVARGLGASDSRNYRLQSICMYGSVFNFCNDHTKYLRRFDRTGDIGL